MKIALLVLLIAVALRSAAPVFADQRYQQMRGQQDVASQRHGRGVGSLRYDDAAFSLSYRYNNSAFGRQPRQRHQGRGWQPPQRALGLRHRHHDSGYGLHQRHRQHDSGYGLHQRRRTQGYGVAAEHRFAGYGRYKRSYQYRHPLRPRRY